MGPSGHLWVRQLLLPTGDPLEKVADGAFRSKLDDEGESLWHLGARQPLLP